MKRHFIWLALVGGLVSFGAIQAQSPARWKSHDMNRPRPPVVKPAELSLPVPPPEDASVLFDGNSLSEWRDGGGGAAQWKVENGYMEAVPGTGSIVSRENFGDVQLHLEWAAPLPASGEGQNRGNSGVYLMSLYEVQILDSYANVTYADGQAAALYGQLPPLHNACLPPGQWQSYDIFFRRPRFDSVGALRSPARVTVIHNGILVQDAAELAGPTNWLQPSPYFPHPDRLPLMLQEHDSPVRFRNIWVRELAEWIPPGPPEAVDPVVFLAEEVLDLYVGRYQFEDEGILTVSRDGAILKAHFFGPSRIELTAHSRTDFSLRWTAARLVFDLDGDGKPRGVTFSIGGEQRRAVRVE